MALPRKYTLSTHDEPGKTTYKRWFQMCYGNQDVCQWWRDSFQNFLDDMGHYAFGKYTIRRKHEEQPFSKGNCYWGKKKLGRKKKPELLAMERDAMRFREWLFKIKDMAENAPRSCCSISFARELMKDVE